MNINCSTVEYVSPSAATYRAWLISSSYLLLALVESIEVNHANGYPYTMNSLPSNIVCLSLTNVSDPVTS